MQCRGALFKNPDPPADMIFDSHEAEKQKVNETTNGAHAKFEPVKADLISHVDSDESEIYGSRFEAGSVAV